MDERKMGENPGGRAREVHVPPNQLATEDGPIYHLFTYSPVDDRVLRGAVTDAKIQDCGVQ